LQTFDLTTLTAICNELRLWWLPSRLEQVYQRDRHTIAIALRTVKQRGWLEISWHPQAAHICIGDAPPRSPDTFTFSQQLLHQLGGLALVGIETIAPWERVVDLQFAHRPGEEALYHLFVEIMGKYSNVILTNAGKEIITVAHQVNQQQSSVRPILTGQPYETPPTLTSAIPNRSESEERWQQRVGLVPGSIKRQLLKNYRGLSPALIESMVKAAGLNPDTNTDTFTQENWQQLFQMWQQWLQILEERNFQPAFTDSGYTVIPWISINNDLLTPVKTCQDLINGYYKNKLGQERFSQLRHQLSQKLNNILEKLGTKEQTFSDRLKQSDNADDYKDKADLLMAYLHEWKIGMQFIALPDFETGQPVTIPLEADKNAIQNAQKFYKQHQKLKRARIAVKPLLDEVNSEIEYLEQVEAAITQIDNYQNLEDIENLEEIREELIQQKYLEDLGYRRSNTNESSRINFYRYQTPNGFEVLVGRNNRQNDQLTFRVAGDYDLWFHAQEIPGSHVLLRLNPGAAAEENDLQFTANLAAYHSRARQSDQVPVIYTQPKYVYKPKGAKPGIAIYKQEIVIWGQPTRIKL
jgi:predicted ribosome quality control (RQC) complex YloA/Tae2 family protein